MLRSLLAFALISVPFFIRAAEEPGRALEGKVEGRVYVSPTGMFKVAIPVLPELGGEVTDTPNVVTFEDAFNIHTSIAAFPHDATQRWELATRGQKDYLIYFFGNFVLADFKQSFQGVQIESAKFIPSLLDGALLTYILVPGGTMFGDKIPQLGLSETIPVAKRGNLLFVKNGHIFVISIELAERVLEGKAYKKTKDEEDEILRQRLMDTVGKIQFAKLPTPAPAPAPAPVAEAKK
ncbi:MAG: hypothetical protein ABIZ49_01250 [Opitutaceae bacterium]